MENFLNQRVKVCFEEGSKAKAVKGILRKLNDFCHVETDAGKTFLIARKSVVFVRSDERE